MKLKKPLLAFALTVAIPFATRADVSIVDKVVGAKKTASYTTCNTTQPCCYLVYLERDLPQGIAGAHSVVATNLDDYHQSFQLFAAAPVHGHPLRMFPTGAFACGGFPALAPQVSFE